MLAATVAFVMVAHLMMVVAVVGFGKEPVVVEAIAGVKGV